MLSVYVLLVSLLHAASPQLFAPVFNPLLSVFGVGPQCGPCPPVADCRQLPPILLGFCCGCALPIDRVPLVCPANLLCPRPSPQLCGDYNYLMDCCC